MSSILGFFLLLWSPWLIWRAYKWACKQEEKRTDFRPSIYEEARNDIFKQISLGLMGIGPWSDMYGDDSDIPGH